MRSDCRDQRIFDFCSNGMAARQQQSYSGPAYLITDSTGSMKTDKSTNFHKCFRKHVLGGPEQNKSAPLCQTHSLKSDSKLSHISDISPTVNVQYINYKIYNW